MTGRQLALTGLLSSHVRPALEPLGYEYLRRERSFVKTERDGNWAAVSFDPFRGRAGQYFIEAGVQSRVVADWSGRFGLLDPEDRTAWSAVWRRRVRPGGFGEHVWVVDADEAALHQLVTTLTDLAVTRAASLVSDERLLAFLEQDEEPERAVVPAWIDLVRLVLRRHLHPGADLGDVRAEVLRSDRGRIPEGLREPYALLLGL